MNERNNQRTGNPESWEQMVRPDLLIGIESEDEEPPYPPFTGKQFLAKNDTLNNHPYSVAFSQFLSNGIDPDTANELAFGLHSAIINISDDPCDDMRVRAVDIFDRFCEMNYWRNSGETDRERVMS